MGNTDIDVFLSHNRRDKPWVREFYRFLVERGVRVFFDEENVMPGENIVSAIESAVQRSRHVVLVISPASLASHWVALEAQLTIHEDPDATQHRLIPLILEDVDKKTIRPAIRTLNCIDLTEPTGREHRLTKVLSALGVESLHGKDLQPLLSALDRRAVLPPLRVGGVGEVLDWGWDGEKLLEEFIALDYATLDGLQDAHEGNPRQWAPVFMNHPETWRMLFSEPMKIQGYWHFAPLFPDDYLRAKAGTLLDSEITADRVKVFELAGEYDVYFVQLCLHPRFRHPVYVRQLFRSVLDVFQGLTENGIFVRELCANAYTDVGKSICRSFNLEKTCPHREHGTIYVGSISQVLKSSLSMLNPVLLQQYREVGLL